MKEKQAIELGFKKTFFKSAEIIRNYEGHAYKQSIENINGKYCRASIGEDFPINDCLNAEAYGIIVSLWIKKEDFETREEGPYYNFDTVIFKNCPHGRLLFSNIKPKTIAKLYTKKAIELAS